MRLWPFFLRLMKIISWNVNSVRARIENIKNYIKDSAPDLLLLQEIKTQNENFPIDEFKSLGYISYIFGQKSYNGVAIISNEDLSIIAFPNIISSSFDFKSKPKLYLKPEHPPP